MNSDTEDTPLLLSSGKYDITATLINTVRKSEKPCCSSSIYEDDTTLQQFSKPLSPEVDGTYRRKSESALFPPSSRKHEWTHRYIRQIDFTKNVSKFTKEQKIILTIVALINILTYSTISILAPFFIEEAAMKDVSLSVAGYIFSTYALIMFIASPFMSYLIPKVGPKKLFLAGVFMEGICNILFGVLDQVTTPEYFITLCFVVRFFEALGGAAFNCATYTILAQVFPDNIGTVTGICETAIGVGQTVGPAVGGLLYDIGGYGLPFFFLGGFLLATLPICWCILPYQEIQGKDETAPSSFWELFKSPAIVTISMVIVTSSIAVGFLYPTLEPHLREFDLNGKEIGVFFLVNAISYACLSPFWGFLADKMNKSWILMVVGLFLTAQSLLLLGPTPFLPFKNVIWINVIALIFLGIFSSMALIPCFEALLIQAAYLGYPENTVTYSLVASIWSSTTSFGEATGGAIAATIMEYYGFPIAATFTAILCVFMAVETFLHFSLCDSKPILDADPIINKTINSAINPERNSVSSNPNPLNSYDSL